MLKSTKFLVLGLMLLCIALVVGKLADATKGEPYIHIIASLLNWMTFLIGATVVAVGIIHVFFPGDDD